MDLASLADVHRAAVQAHLDLGFDEVYLHNVGRDQRALPVIFAQALSSLRPS